MMFYEALGWDEPTDKTKIYGKIFLILRNNFDIYVYIN